MREERPHLFGTTRTPAGPLCQEYTGMTRLMGIVRAVNPSGNTVNCGHTIDAAAHRLSGVNATAVSHNIGLGGSFDQIGTRHGTSFTWRSDLGAIFSMVRSGGHGTIALIGIKYATGGAHVVCIGNVDGVVGICEGQDWSAGKPPEVVASVHKANARYNSSGNNNIGVAVVRWGCPLRSGWEGSHTSPRAVQPRPFRHGNY